MQTISVNFFPGPNRHVLRPAIEAIVDLGQHGTVSTTTRPSFVTALIAGFPGLSDHYCSRGRPGGLVERLHEGTYLGHVVEHLALEYLFLGGETGVYGKTREVATNRVMVVFESETKTGGIKALNLAVETVLSLWDNPDRGWSSERIVQFRHELAQHRLGPSTRAILEAARRRDIPVARLDDANFVRLGQGVRQRRIRATMTDQTNIVGVEAAQDKELTSRLVYDAGLPVPKRHLVDSLAQAGDALREMGSPVVVKPLDQNHGRGVTMNVVSPEDLAAAHEAVRASSDRPFVVEQQIEGRTLRLMVVGSQMVAATERRVPQIVGTGQHTVRELVGRLNQDPRRGPDHGFPMSWVVWDADAAHTVAGQGLELDQVVPEGMVVRLRCTANMSTGATARDVTREVSAELARDAVRAAHAVGLDIAGVDVVTPKFDRSLLDAGGAVIEVNAAPGLRMHLFPEEGPARPVADRIVDHLFGSGDGRIPVAAVTGTNGKTTVTRMLGHMAARAGLRVGMSTTDGINIGGELIKRGDLTGPWSARLVLNDPTVELAVLETARGGMARGGLGLDDVDVGVITNIGQDHLGQDGIETLADLIHLKSLVVDVVRPGGKAVLNADDPNVVPLQNRCRGRVVLFSTNPENPQIDQHRLAGGEVVFVKRGYLYYGRGGYEKRLIGTRALPSSLGGLAAVNVANAAAAAAAGLALGLTPRQIVQGLSTFPAGGAGLNRGRLEMLEGGDIRVLVDYGHNLPAIVALGEICRRLKPRQIVTVVGLPGDRRDDDIRESARVIAGFSQHIIIREDTDLRGRMPGETAELIRRGIAGQGDRQVRVVLDEVQAVTEAIVSAEAGMLVLILYEQYGRVRQAAEEALARREPLNQPSQEALARA